MLRIAAGRDVQINVVADRSCGHDRILFVLGGELNKGIAGLGVDNGALFNPADLVLLGSDLEEAPAAFEDFELLPVHHLGHAIGDGGYPVVEVHLAGGDVHRLVPLLVKPGACAHERKKTEGQERGQRRQRGHCRPQARDQVDGGG